MWALWAVSLLWAFSFGLIGNTLAGVDPWFLALARLSISLFVFIPFTRLQGISISTRLQLAAIGAVQYGLMYILLFSAFNFLRSHEVALFTIFTPIYVTLINDISKRRFHPVFLVTAILAVVGTAIIKWGQISRDGLLFGFAIMQASNICFATGQIWYRNLMEKLSGQSNSAVFALLYLGASLMTLIFAIPMADWGGLALEPSQIGVIVYLGAVASGLGFFLWNVGARSVNAGTLAVFNNLKIPLAIAVSLLVFREETSLVRLLAGLAMVVGALLIDEHLVREREKSQTL